MNQQDDQEMQYQRIQDDKDQALDGVINRVRGVRRVVDATGTQLVDQGKTMDRINDKLANAERKAERTNNKMENYLRRTSNCKLIIAFIVEAFLFILIMSI